MILSWFSGKSLIVGAALAAVTAMPGAQAATLDEFTVIVGGWQLERHCKHLSDGKRATLGEAAAHAEIDMARQHGATEVNRIVEGAEAFGREKGADCGTETRQAVIRSYGFAIAYAKEKTAKVSRKTRKAEKRKAEKRKAEKRKTEKREARKQEPEEVVVEAPSETRATSGALKRYRKQTEAYYLQYRCKHLPYRQAVAFWNLIKTQHYALIRKYGAGAVGRMSRQAKSRANRGSVYCGANTRKKVHAGLRSVRRDVVSN